MGPGKRTLAIVALTTTIVSCTSRPAPAATPTVPVPPPRIYATTATVPLLNDLLSAYTDAPIEHAPESRQTNYRVMLESLYGGEISYFLTNHISVDSNLWAAPIARSSIALVVHEEVGVESLTLDQLRAIYQGRITSWAEIGGSDRRIVLFTREDGSGTRLEFERLVMGFRSTARNARVATSSVQVLEQVRQQEGSIGYVPMGYLNEDTVTLSINGVELSSETIAQNRYPLQTTIYVMGLAEPEGNVRQFIGWVQGQEGQAVVAIRYVPLAISSLQLNQTTVRATSNLAGQ